MSELATLQQKAMALMKAGDMDGAKAVMDEITKAEEDGAVAKQRKEDLDWATKEAEIPADLKTCRKDLINALVELRELKRASKTKVVKTKDGKTKKTVQKCNARKAWENKTSAKLAEGVWHRSFNDLKPCGKTVMKGEKYCACHSAEAETSKSGLPIDGDFGEQYDWPAHKTDPRRAGWLKAVADAHPKWAAEGQFGVCLPSKSPVSEKVSAIEMAEGVKNILTPPASDEEDPVEEKAVAEEAVENEVDKLAREEREAITAKSKATRLKNKAIKAKGDAVKAKAKAEAAASKAD